VPDRELSGTRGGRWPRPARGSLLTVPAAVALELIGRLIGNDWVTLVAAGLVGAVAAAAFLTPSVRRIHLVRDTPQRWTAGVESAVRITVTNNRKHRGAGPFRVTDAVAGLEPQTILVPRLAAGASAVAQLRRTPPHRGQWHAGAVITVDGCSPLGGFRRRRRFSDDRPTVVHPAPVAALALADRSARTHAGRHGSSRRVGRSSEVLGLREWRPGDAAGAVSWRASAARGRLVVLEREQPTAGHVVVAVGTVDAGEQWEHAVARAAATACAALRTGRRVTLVVGSEATTPTSALAALDWFAALDRPVATSADTLRTVLSRDDAALVWLSTTPLESAATGLTAGVWHLGGPARDGGR
jgi:uncharacterized protein (DUF58 family)